MKTILVAIDFSPMNRSVLRAAVELAGRVHGRLKILHVVSQPAYVADYSGVVIDTTAIVKAAERGARRRLDELSRRLARLRIKATHALAIGIPADEILREAEKSGAGYVVIGSQGHNALYNLIIGSTTAAVLRGAACPVIVVPAPARGRGKRPRRP